MNPDDFKRPMDEQELASFYQPLFFLQEMCGTRYSVQAPPLNYVEAREFSVRLWDCCDEDEATMLVESLLEGAAQFAYLASVYSARSILLYPGKNETLAQESRKQFSLLASCVLDWLDEVEAQAPGKTRRL